MLTLKESGPVTIAATAITGMMSANRLRAMLPIALHQPPSMTRHSVSEHSIDGMLQVGQTMLAGLTQQR